MFVCETECALLGAHYCDYVHVCQRERQRMKDIDRQSVSISDLTTATNLRSLATILDEIGL